MFGAAYGLSECHLGATCRLVFEWPQSSPIYESFYLIGFHFRTMCTCHYARVFLWLYSAQLTMLHGRYWFESRKHKHTPISISNPRLSVHFKQSVNCWTCCDCCKEREHIKNDRRLKTSDRTPCFQAFNLHPALECVHLVHWKLYGNIETRTKKVNTAWVICQSLSYHQRLWSFHWQRV